MDPLDYPYLVQKYLSESNTEAAFASVNEVDALDSASQITLIIREYLTEDASVNNPAVFQACKEIFNVIAEKCDPEDVLLDLLDIIPRCTDTVAFLSHLQPLLTVMVRLPIKRLTSYKWGLNAVTVYLKKLRLPDDLNNPGDDSSQEIVSVYEGVLAFYSNLIGNLSDEVSSNYKLALLEFIVQLLGRPLVCFDLREPAALCDIARRIVTITLDLNRDIFIFDVCNKVEKGNALCFGVLYYLVLVERYGLERTPKVYDRVYVFQTSLTFITELCKQEWRFSIEKGLDLLECVLISIADVVLPYYLLEASVHCYFCKTIMSVVVYNPNEGLRSKGTKLFRKYLFSFDNHGRYLLVYNLAKTLDHVQSMAYIIQTYKQMMLQDFNKNFTRSEISVYYSGLKLFVLLDLFCWLYKGAESDLLEISSLIISSLNLLRFLLQYDRNNITQVWDYVTKLQRKYLEPLGNGLVLSKRYYTEKLREVKENYSVGDGGTEVSIVVAGQTLPHLEVAQRINIYHNALNTLDLIEAILSWLNEVITSKL